MWSPYLVKQRRLIENIQRRATKFILNYLPREVSYVNRLDQLNLLPLDFRRQMHDLVLLFKYKTGTVTSNFGRFIQTATWQYRTRNFHQANFDLLSRHNQEYCRNSYLPRTVKLWNSLPNILESSQDLFWFRVHLNDHFRGLLQTYSPCTMICQLFCILRSLINSMVIFFLAYGIRYNWGSALCVSPVTPQHCYSSSFSNVIQLFQLTLSD